MSSQYDLMSIDIIKVANKIPSAQLILLDGDAPRQTFDISNTAFFEPGKEIEIKLCYEGEEGEKGQDTTVFKGIAVKHSVSAGSNTSFLTVDLRDAAVKLTTTRKSIVFKDMKDSAIIQKIVSDGGLTAESITETACQHKEMVQFYCNDWDFMLFRADANGHCVLVNDGSITTKAPKITGSPAFTFEYGISEISEFEMEADIREQFDAVESASWDIAEQKLSDPKTAAAFSLEQGNLDPAKMAKTISADKCKLIHPVDAAPEEMKAWADAKMTKSRMSMLRGRLRIPGDAKIKPGDVVEIKGIGDRFNGKTLVTGVRHQVSLEGWNTDIQFGLSSDWFSRNDDIIDTPSAGLIPAINGLHIGIVDAYEADPDNKFRVKVKMPAIDATEDAIWARLTTLDAGNTRGTFFRPEKGDEVVLGFLNDDPRQAVILGSLHSEKNAMPTGFEITEDNYLKGLVTKESLKVLFDDENKLIELSTPNGNLFRISDTDKGIHIEDENGNKATTNDKGIILEDKNGNKMTTDDKGITLEDKNGNKMTTDDKGITLEDRNGNKVINDSQGITLKAGKDINIKGTNVKIEGSKVDIN